MGFLMKFLTRIVLNGAALYIATVYFAGFILTGGIETLIIAAVILALLNTFLRPIIHFVALPFVWITFGLFNFVIYIIILKIADAFLWQITITNLPTLFWVSIVVALANSVI